MKIYNEIRRYRLQYGFTQQQLADILGISKNSVSEYELNHMQPRSDKALMLCALFDIPVNFLFHVEEN